MLFVLSVVGAFRLTNPRKGTETGKYAEGCKDAFSFYWLEKGELVRCDGMR
jgi:hypothetical protein